MIGLLIALVVAGGPPEITPTARLARARVCYEALDFDCAESELAAARLGMRRLVGDERVTVLVLSAQVALATQRQGDAEHRIRALLLEAPDFEPDPKAWPEPWRKTFEAVRATAPDRQPPRLEVRVPVTVEPGQAFEVRVVAEDRSGVAGVRLFVLGAGEPIALATTDGRTWRATVPGGLVVAPAVPIWVEATDQRGNGPARWGSAGLPRQVHVTRPEDDESVVTTWWFWTAVGGAAVVAAATGLTVWYLTNDGDGAPPAPMTETGSVQVGVPQWFIP